ncbi:unnamed protein product [marine sediment metagenome]|uniref:Methyltransferase type 11 domain-containing protein n=1 Tax=marine sediment metagenome TaxID=412755 RepID=X1FW08_9ZZZZ
MAASTQWQTQLSSMSLKKQRKYALVDRIIPDCSGKKCLEIGSETGVLVDFLRSAKGGEWYAGALEQHWVDESRSLVGDNVVLIDPRKIDFKDGYFDLVVASRPEHIDDDQLFFKEVYRILRPGGMVVITSPHDERDLWLNDIKERIGLTMEQYDHYRRGYSDTMLNNRLSKAGFNEIRIGSYCRFFTEFIEMTLNAAYVFINRGKAGDRSARELSYRPTSGEDVQSNKKILTMYKMVYPLLFLMSRLDKLLFFSNGYVIYATARRP